MTPATLPLDETERLRELARYEVLDTPAEEAFDGIVGVAASLCGVPIALVSLIDESRQWFKARCGLEAAETPREQAFCAHAIHAETPFIVPDALADERFADNPLVVGGPKIRFYCGVPLQTPRGHRIGTLCVIDRVPRELEPVQVETLRMLARLVVGELELGLVGRALREANRELDRACAAKNRLLEIAAHDLRNPLATIRGTADLELLDAEALPIEQRESFTMIRRQSDVALGLVRDLLEVSGLQAGRLVLAPMTTSPVVALREAFELSAGLARDKGVALEWRIPDDLPEATFDPGRIVEVVSELLANAIRVSRPGGMASLGARFDRRRVEIWVDDRAGAIPEADLPGLFAPFATDPRAASAAARGTGLGLAIVHDLLEAHGSPIRVESIDGGGSRFAFDLRRGAGDPPIVDSEAGTW